MASKYKVVTFGNPVLRKKAAPVAKVDTRIRKLASEMLEVMYASNGLGLAAEQVGETDSICVIDIPVKELAQNASEQVLSELPTIPMPVVMVNPRIIHSSGEAVGQEGCLSFPELFVNIKRAAEVVAVYTDLDNKEQTVQARGLFARAVQHELDHLHGILLVDRMSTVQKLASSAKLKKIKKATAEA